MAAIGAPGLISSACLARGAAPALPGIGGGTRQVVDPDVPPWRIIGRVQTETGSRCTGFLVAPSVVETAAHCLYIPRTGLFISPSSVHFLTGYHDGRYRAHAVATRIVLAPGYNPRRPALTATSDDAVIVLDHRLATASDLLRTAKEVRPGMPAMLAGYEQDRAERLSADTACHVTAVSHAVIAHDCATTRGASGAPLLVRAAGGGWMIAGVAVRADAGRGGFALPIFRETSVNVAR